MSLPTSARAEWADTHESHGDHSENEDCPLCRQEMETVSCKRCCAKLFEGDKRSVPHPETENGAICLYCKTIDSAPEGTESPLTRKSVNVVETPEMPSDRQIRALCWHLGQAGYNDNHEYVKNRMTKSEAQSILSFLMKSNYEDGIAQLEYLASKVIEKSIIQ